MPTDPTTAYPLLAVAAFVAGAVNSVAGGGTLLTFPALVAPLAAFGDRAEAVANATSTVALLPGSLAGAWGYRKELADSRPLAVKLVPVSLLGGGVGAVLLAAAPAVFAALVPWLVLAAAGLFAAQPTLSRLTRRRSADRTASGWRSAAGLYAFQFVVAVYGGYFGAGIGILMLAVMGFAQAGDIHRMNAVKTLLAAAINATSVAVFVASGLIHWPFAGAMAAAAVAGGYAGARVARRLPVGLVRGVVTAIGFGLAGHYFLT